MKLPNYSWLIFLALASIPRLNATDINGTVQSATPEYATVTSDSDLIKEVAEADPWFNNKHQIHLWTDSPSRME